MNTAAQTNSTGETANVDAIDSIVDLLVEDPDNLQESDQGDSNDAEKLSDESTEESDVSDDSENESKDDGDEEESDEEETSEGESDETWSSALGVDDSKIEIDEDGNFSGVKVKVDGEESTVNMETLIAGFQNNRNNTNKSKSLSEDRVKFESEKDVSSAEYEKRLGDVSKLTEYLGNTLNKEFNSINWDQLRVENPAEYAASMQDFNTRQTEINNVYSAIEEEQQKQQYEFTSKNQQMADDNMRTQVGKMIENNPEWSDRTKLKAAFDTMREFTTGTYGFTDDEFGSIADARLVEIIKDAQSFREGVKKVKLKTGKKIPKFQKSDRKKVSKKVTKLDTLTKRAKSSSGAAKRSAQTDAIVELLKEG